MKKELIERILTSEGGLPPIPVAWVQIIGLLRDPDADVAALAQALSRDLALTTEILKLANSSRYGPAERVLSIEKAAVVLGVRAVRNLMLQVSLLHDYRHLSGNGVLDLGDFWRHCVISAELAQRLADASTRYRGPDPEDLFTCGLLHDMGVLVLLANGQEYYLDILRTSQESGRELHEVEQDVLGYTHMEIGALLSTRWKLPGQITRTIRHHHRANKAAPGDHGLAIVSLASRGAHALLEEERPAGWTLLAPRLAKRLGLAVPKLEEVMDDVSQLEKSP